MMTPIGWSNLTQKPGLKMHLNKNYHVFLFVTVNYLVINI